MQIIINTTSHRYPVKIAPGIINTFKFPENSIIVTDNNLRARLTKKFPQYPVVSFTAGENSKHLLTIEKLAKQLVKLGADRTSNIIAIGGGVVGDMAGFLASIYMRGIPVYQVPTSLLAMVDASVGGKTGVDLLVGKNLLGTFHQPQAVIIDPEFLLDLPADQLRNGMGEVIKHGVLHKPLFLWLEQHLSQIFERDIDILTQLIIKNVQVKAKIVNGDEKETAHRMLLNLGHTFGHAIEQLSKYTIPHGEAVTIGLVYAANFAQCKELDRIIDIIHECKLPSSLAVPYSPSVMIKAMQNDKKNQGKYITLVLPKALGKVEINTQITTLQLQNFLQSFLKA